MKTISNKIEDNHSKEQKKFKIDQPFCALIIQNKEYGPRQIVSTNVKIMLSKSQEVIKVSMKVCLDWFSH